MQKKLFYITTAYLAIRLFSFLTYYHPTLNAIIATILILSFSYVAFKKPALAWIILVGELLLDGTGHFFELHGLILRTWFLGIFGIIWLWHTLKQRTLSFPSPKYIRIGFALLCLTLVMAIANGFIKHHVPTHIFQDAMLYGFIFLLFPAIQYKEDIRSYLPTFLHAFIVGSAIFSLVTFLIYATGLGELPDWYYHWIRNVAGGKITDLGGNFFRVVFSEHLLFVSIILALIAKLIQTPKQTLLWVLLLLSTFILSLNFTRIYFVALAVGLLVLVIKQPVKRWFIVSATVPISIFLFFSLFNILTSHGQTAGLQLLGFKVNGITTPTSDPSGAIRLAILPNALERIHAHPWFGNGLGTTVTYIDPISKQEVTRTQFDFGYHEMLAELGIIGTTFFLFFLLSILYTLARQTYSKAHLSTKQIALRQGLLAGGISLFVVNITTPALFQGFGVLFFVGVMVVIADRK